MLPRSPSVLRAAALILLSTTASSADVPKTEPAKTGVVTDFQVKGFGSSRQKGSVEIKGTGKCMLILQLYDMSKPLSPSTPNAYREIWNKTFYPTTLPVTVNDIGPFPDGPYQF